MYNRDDERGEGPGEHRARYRVAGHSHNHPEHRRYVMRLKAHIQTPKYNRARCYRYRLYLLQDPLLRIRQFITITLDPFCNGVDE